GGGFLPAPCGIFPTQIRRLDAPPSKTRQNSRNFVRSLLASRLPCPRLSAIGRGDRGMSKESLMIAREQVQAVLDRVRPYLKADGGDVELVTVEGNSVAVRLTGL